MKKILLAISAVALMFAGCTKDFTNDVVNNGGIEAGELVVKNLVFEDTRLDRDDVSGKLAWSEGDKVYAVLQGEGGALSLDANTYTVDHTNSTVAIPSNTAYIIYMSNKPTLDGTTAKFDLSHTVTLENPEDIFDHNPMKGVVEGENIVFKNLLGYIKVPVKGTSKLKGVYVRTICRTTSEFFPISKAATLNLSKEVGKDGNVAMATNNSAFAFTHVAYKSALDITNGEDIYVAMPEGTYEDMALVFVTEEGSQAVYATKPHTVTRSAIKPISASHIDIDAHTPANPVSLAGTTGKANEDYARCYMVPPTAGSYEFPCILADGVVLKGGVTAEIKWAEEGGMIYDLYYNPETNKISFKTNGKEGNAQIVLTDGAATATIIWHWHIWITDTPKTLEVVGTNSTKYYLMDRVVGATWSPASVIETTSTQTLTNGQTGDKLQSGEVSFNNTMALEDANAACGIYFQYQNCNPYPRVKSLGWVGKEKSETLVNTRCDVMYGFSQYAQYWSTSASGANVYKSGNVEEGQTLYIHNGIRMPNYQYKKAEGSTSAWILDNILNNKDVNSNNSLLSEGNYRFWCSHNNNDHATMMSGKTAHDPCPPGYIIENYSIEYWYMTKDAARKAAFGYARAKEDNATDYHSGYKFYGMYYNNATDEKGNKVPLYWPCDGSRESCVSGVSGQYSNCGYIYSVNTNNKDTYAIGGKTYGKACAICYGECISAYKAPGLLAESAGKVVNSQAYNVRCRRGKF